MREAPSVGDFIEVYHDALPRELCAAIIARFDADASQRPGQVGGGVFPDLKHSRDISLQGRADWADVEGALNRAVFQALLRYVRRYPHMLIAPLMFEIQGEDGRRRRITAEDLAAADDGGVARLLEHALRPGWINLQRYEPGVGGYPYWHCELFPRAPDAETLHRHVLWTVYLNEGFGEGETEFLYQGRKVVPSTGSLLVAPAAFTHTHRGNRPQGGAKYIATSWALFNRAERLFPGG